MNDVVQTSIDASLQAAQPIPLWLTILFVVAAIAFCAWIYATERGTARRGQRIVLAALRLAALLCVLWMICGYSWIRFTSDRPELVIVLDRSASMSTRDVPHSTEKIGRLEWAMDLLQQIPSRTRAAIDERYQTRWFALAESVESLAVDWSQIDALPSKLVADGEHSRLGDGLHRIIQRQAGSGTAAIVLISDGINTSGSSLDGAIKAARLAAIPVSTVAVGRQFALPDLRLADLLLDRDVYFGDQVVVELSVIASDVGQATTRLSIRDAATGQLLDETRVVFNEAAHQHTARLSFVPQRPGEMTLDLRIAALENESELENNALTTTINVQDKTVKVLMVFESPSYEFRFLKSLLERSTQQGDPQTNSFDLACVLQDADVEYVRQDRSAMRLVPSSAQALEEYDVFVFGEFDPALVSRGAQRTIYEAVSTHGAGCVFVFGNNAAAGRIANWPLAGLLPTLESGDGSSFDESQHTFHWQPTQVGSAALPMQLAESPEQSSLVWQRMPSLQSVMRVDAIKPGAQVLANAVDDASGNESPLLITQFAGAGRSALQATDETYVWTSLAGSDVYHQRYWGQLLRWLSRGKLRGDQQSEFIVDPKQARYGQPIRLQWTQASEKEATEMVDVMIEGSHGRRIPVSLKAAHPASQVYSATISDLPPDSYRALVLKANDAEATSVDFVVSAPPNEQANLRADLEALRRVAEQSRGRFYTEQDAQRLFSELPPGRTTRLGSLPPKPIWNSPWVALLFVLLITAEWLLRRSTRML